MTCACSLLMAIRESGLGDVEHRRASFTTSVIHI
jgi:hypothetical protein